MKKISVIVPCYNEQEAIPFFYDEIVKISKIMENDAEFEYLFINDGSKDKTINVLRELAKRDERVKYVFFFKQKTAYEILFSDWSSDVCSSDLTIPLTLTI